MTFGHISECIFYKSNLSENLAYSLSSRMQLWNDLPSKLKDKNISRLQIKCGLEKYSIESILIADSSKNLKRH